MFKAQYALLLARLLFPSGLHTLKSTAKKCTRHKARYMDKATWHHHSPLVTSLMYISLKCQ